MSVAILALGSVCASMVGMEQTRERISARERAKTKKREEKLKKKEAKRKQKKGKRWAWSTERAAAEFESSLVAPARLLLAQEHEDCRLLYAELGRLWAEVAIRDFFFSKSEVCGLGEDTPYLRAQENPDPWMSTY